VLLTGKVARHTIINRNRHRDGRRIWVEAQLRALKDSETGINTGINGAPRDISICKALEDELAEASRRLRALAG
jgi:PAS domain-containing protein